MRAMTLAELAARLESTPSAVHQLEQSEDAGTIKMRSLRTALAAMDVELRIEAVDASPLAQLAPYRVADHITSMLDARESTGSILRYLTYSIAEARLNEFPNRLAEWEREPRTIPDVRWDSLFRALYRHEFTGPQRQPWMNPNRLEHEWFVNDLPLIQDRALSTTPDFLAELNIYLDRNSLVRA